MHVMQYTSSPPFHLATKKQHFLNAVPPHACSRRPSEIKVHTSNILQPWTRFFAALTSWLPSPLGRRRHLTLPSIICYNVCSSFPAFVRSFSSGRFSLPPRTRCFTFFLPPFGLSTFLSFDSAWAEWNHRYVIAKPPHTKNKTAKKKQATTVKILPTPRQFVKKAQMP